MQKTSLKKGENLTRKTIFLPVGLIMTRKGMCYIFYHPISRIRPHRLWNRQTEEKRNKILPQKRDQDIEGKASKGPSSKQRPENSNLRLTKTKGLALHRPKTEIGREKERGTEGRETHRSSSTQKREHKRKEGCTLWGVWIRAPRMTKSPWHF